MRAATRLPLLAAALAGGLRAASAAELCGPVGARVELSSGPAVELCRVELELFDRRKGGEPFLRLASAEGARWIAASLVRSIAFSTAPAEAPEATVSTLGAGELKLALAPGQVWGYATAQDQAAKKRWRPDPSDPPRRLEFRSSQAKPSRARLYCPAGLEPAEDASADGAYACGEKGARRQASEKPRCPPGTTLKLRPFAGVAHICLEKGKTLPKP